jgi:hypothetical protein
LTASRWDLMRKRILHFIYNINSLDKKKEKKRKEKKIDEESKKAKEEKKTCYVFYIKVYFDL